LTARFTATAWGSYQYEGQAYTSMHIEVLAWLLDASGAPVSARRVVAADAVEQHTDPALGFAADGRLLVAWAACASFDPETGGVHDCHVRARWYDDALEPDGASFALAPGVPGEQQGPALAVDPTTGRIVVLWTEDRDAPVGTVIRGQWLTPAGQPDGLPFDVSTADGRDQFQPHAAFSPTGDLLAVWAAETGAAPPGTLLARRYDPAGQPEGDPEDLLPGVTTNRRRTPRVAFEAGGAAMVAWCLTSSAGCMSYELLTVDPAGDPGGVNTAGPGTDWVFTPGLFSPAAGEFDVVWSSGMQPQPPSLVHRRFDATGQALGATSALARGLNADSAGCFGYLPDAAALPDGRHLISHATDCGDSTVFVALQRYAPSGTPLGNRPW
jgi:hypothetical protein